MKFSNPILPLLILDFNYDYTTFVRAQVASDLLTL